MALKVVDIVELLNGEAPDGRGKNRHPKMPVALFMFSLLRALPINQIGCTGSWEDFQRSEGLPGST